MYTMGHWSHRGPWAYHRGPSRLLWFAIGAGTTAWWFKHHSNEKFGRCGPRPIENSSVQSPETMNPQQWSYRGAWTTEQARPPPAVDNFPAPPAMPTPQSSPPIQTNPYAWTWDGERQQLEKMSKQATDAMTNLTESTLESVLATAEALKAKLAEHRAEREKQQKLIERQLEEQRRNPPRLV